MFIKFPEIGGLHNVKQYVNYIKTEHGTDTEALQYNAMIKLHGTNAAITIHAGEVFAQSRTSIITPDSDNAGFAAFVEQMKTTGQFDEFVEESKAHPQYALTVFGEWCGPGIQKGVAINKIPEKVFVIFAVVTSYVNNLDEFGVDEVAEVTTDAQMYEHFWADNPRIKKMPFFLEDITIDFNDTAALKQTVAMLEKEVDRIGKTDPWVKHAFGVDGIGEGMVLVPVPIWSETDITMNQYSNFTFKVKNEAHKVTSSKNVIEIDPVKLESISQFVEMFVTPNRLEQGLTESSDGVFDQKKIGSFIGWVSKDVEQESRDELTASELVWKDVAAEIAKTARTWYLQNLRAL
jgi:hypothetical protein